MAVYLLLTVLGGIGAYILFQLSAPQQRSVGSDVTPDMLILTNQRQVSVYVTVKYFKSYPTDKSALAIGSPSGSFPNGTRFIEIQFYGGKPDSRIKYSVLLGRDGGEKSPVGSQNQQFFSGSPGSNYRSDCISPQTSGVVQVLYGELVLNKVGRATADSVGPLANQHAYLADGANDIVGVIDINSHITDLATGSAGQACIFPEWPYLGGSLWYSPASLSGEVSVGQLGNGYSVTSSNPPLTDLSSLTWQINGATAINYTLTNESLAHRQLAESFLAGVVAALAAAMAVEAAKSLLTESAGQDHGDKDLKRAPPERGHPILASIIFLASFFGELRRRRSQ
ncbi:MAG: hypothetical protein ACRDRJ_00775 [Streptosporangiaceae bacterium]